LLGICKDVIPLYANAYVQILVIVLLILRLDKLLLEENALFHIVNIPLGIITDVIGQLAHVNGFTNVNPHGCSFGIILLYEIASSAICNTFTQFIVGGITRSFHHV
jgi:hypothetical protein